MKRRAFLSAMGAGSLLALANDALAAEVKKPPRSPFLEGNFAPIREEVAADNLKVIGKLPRELNGLFVRTGPNPQFEPLGPYHWFDGDGMLHGLRLQDGKASYRNRYVRTEGWNEENKAGKALYTGLMGIPDFKKLAATGEPGKNTGNTALVWYNGRLLALWEGGAPHAIAAPELKTLGRYNFGGKLKHACTAHPKIDAASGEMMFFGYSAIPPYVQYSVADGKGVIQRTTPIALPRAVMMHDFAVTARHTIFLDLPMVFDFTGVFRGKAPLVFEPKHGARIGVLPRHAKGGEIKWFAIPPCYIFHTLNAWDDGDAVVLVACRAKSMIADLSATPMEGMAEDNSPNLYRWRLDLKTGKVKEEKLDDVAGDFPRVDDRLMGKKTRFGYTMKLSMDAYLKYDFEKGTSERHGLGKGRFGGEAVFVPRAGAKSEDDGWLMTYVHDQAANRSEFAVLDAKEFRKPAIARVMLPQRVPFGFHGTWLPEELLGKS